MSRYSAGIRPSHPLKDKGVKIKLHRSSPAYSHIKEGDVFEVEDWWENVTGKRWTVDVLGGNYAAINYAIRAVATNDKLHEPFEPVDDVVYGHVRHLGYIVHNSEIVRA